MKILAISALYPPYVMGGAERSAASLAEGLIEKNNQVSVITLGPPNSSITNYNLNDAKVTRLPLRNNYWPYSVPISDKPSSTWQRLKWHLSDTDNHAMINDVIPHIKATAPDIVMTHNLQGFSTGIWPAISALGIPILHTIHDFALLCPRTVLFKNGKTCGLGKKRCLDCRLLTYPRHKHSGYVDTVVGVSQAVLRIHQEHGLFTEIPSKAILNTVANGVFPKARVRTNLDPRLSFGFLGRVDTPKGFNTLIEAIQQLPKEKVRLVVAGKIEPDYLAQIQSQHDLSNVEFLGFCEPEELFNQIDVLAFPSFALEALGNGVYESYFQGLPVIGSDKGGIPEMIEEGHTGYVFQAGNVEQLKQKMEAFLTHPNLAKSMQTACLDKANYFLPKRRMDAYEEILQRTLIAKT